MTIGALVTYGLLFLSLYFEVFLLVIFLQKRFEKRAPSPVLEPTVFPSVAVIVPCFNEESTVVSTMQSLLALDYPHDKLEIIAVDDGSTDGTYAALRMFESDRRVRVFSKQNGGKHSAMNFGLNQTNAEIVGCLDADSVVQSDALRHIVAVFEHMDVAAVTPGIHVREPKTILQHLQNVEYQLSVFNRFVFAALGSVYITPGPFSFFRTAVIRELGGWRYAHSTEDMEIAMRLQRAGYAIANAPRAIVHTSTPPTMGTLFKQRVRWLYGGLRNTIDYRHMIGNKQYGNLGILILPWILISIVACLYFFVKIILETGIGLYDEYVRMYFSGLYFTPGTLDFFYVNTNTMMFLVLLSVGLIFMLICAGSYIGTGSRRPPAATPIFLLFYSFLVPLWLSTAVVRAIFKTGVRWR